MSEFRPCVVSVIAITASALVTALPAQTVFAALQGEHVPPQHLFALAPVPVDVDRDGQLDLIAWDASGELGFHLLHNDGAMRFVKLGRHPVPSLAGATVVFHRVGDFDGDGWPDVYARRGDRAFLWWNDGHGLLQLSARVDLPNPPEVAGRTADFDGDGRDEIVTPTMYLEHDGFDGLVDHGQTHLPPLPPSTYGSAMVSGDLDGDRDLDVVILALNVNGAPSSRRLLAWLNDGSGRFTAVPSLASAPNPHALADLDGDGRADLVATDDQTGELLLLASDGLGNFATVLHRGSRCARAVALDVDGDGDLDVATAVQGIDHIPTVYLNDGQGHFVAVTWPWPGIGGGSIGNLHDLDSDGRDDLFVQHVGIMTSRGDGTFAVASGPAIPGAAASSALESVLFDVDADGDADLLGGGWILLGDGTGRFPSRHPTLSTDDRFPRTALWDLDGDGDTDVLQFGDNAHARLLRADGHRLVSDTRFDLTPLDRIERWALADIDGDSRQELVGVARSYSRVLRADSSGLPYDAGSVPLLALLPEGTDLVSADFDGNGLDDLAVANGSTRGIELLLQGPPGTFVSHQLDAATRTSRLTATDLDGDGAVDLVCHGNPFDNSAFVLRSEGSLQFTLLPIVNAPPLVHTSAVADFDLDGSRDVLLSMSSFPGAGPAVTVIAYGDRWRGLLPATVVPLGTGIAYVRNVGDVDADGDVDLVASDTGIPATIVALEVLHNLTRQIDLPYLIQPGQPFVVDIWARPGAGGAPRVGYAALGTAALPSVVELEGLGAWRLDMGGALIFPPFLVPAPAGRARQSLLTPSMPALIGHKLFVQGFVLDASAGFGTTNLAAREVR